MTQTGTSQGVMHGKKGLIMTTAESCTGGGVASAITDIAGSSAWFDRAFITYSNQAKMEMLDVDSVVLESHGAVSEPVVKAMVEGWKQDYGADDLACARLLMAMAKTTYWGDESLEQ